ncbi:right-handed parallel beta-helix repeat-containing protein [Patescibacteria group bacterium]|nr:right-handed parallel beta-helix repeat-containing protein [Patescibacteria group bacterium]
MAEETIAYQFKGLIGGGGTNLDGVDGRVLKDGDFAYIMLSGNIQYNYMLDASSGLTQKIPFIVKPLVNADNKRWILQTPYVAYVDATAPDQGAATAEGYRSLKDLIDAIGPTKRATIVCPSTGAGDTTTYTLTTNETVPANISLKMEQGAIIDGAGTLTINGPFPHEGNLSQKFGSSITVSFGPGAIKKDYPEWWGENTTPDTTDMTAEIQAAINAMEGAGGGIVSLVDSIYRISDELVNDDDGVWIEGVSKASTIIKQYGTAGEACLKVSCAVADGYIRSGIRNLTLQGNALSGNGLTLMNAYNYTIENVYAYSNGADGFNLLGHFYYFNMTDCEAKDNGGHGCHMIISGGFIPSAGSLHNCHFNENTGEGLYVENCDGIDIFGGSFQSNGGYGIKCGMTYHLRLFGGWIENNTTYGIYCPATSMGCVFAPDIMFDPSCILGTNRLVFTSRSAGLGDVIESTLGNYLAPSGVDSLPVPHGTQLVIPAIHGILGGSSAITPDTSSMRQYSVKMTAQNDTIGFGTNTYFSYPKSIRPGIYKVHIYGKASIGNAGNISVECTQNENNDGRLLAAATIGINAVEHAPTSGNAPALIWGIVEANCAGHSFKIEIKKLLDDADEVSISHIALEPVEAGSIILLSKTNVSFAADADTEIFRVPSGYRCILDHAKIVAGADAGATTTLSIGANGAETDFIVANTLSNLDAQYDAVILKPIPNTTPLKNKSYAATTVIEAQVANQSGGATNTIWLYGILYK